VRLRVLGVDKPLEEVDALLAAPTPLSFRRRAKLAKPAGTTQPHIADLEGK
jgi:hypothetical protein